MAELSKFFTRICCLSHICFARFPVELGLVGVWAMFTSKTERLSTERLKKENRTYPISP